MWYGRTPKMEDGRRLRTGAHTAGLPCRRDAWIKGPDGYNASTTAGNLKGDESRFVLRLLSFFF